MGPTLWPVPYPVVDDCDVVGHSPPPPPPHLPELSPNPLRPGSFPPPPSSSKQTKARFSAKGSQQIRRLHFLLASALVYGPATMFSFAK